jgi:cholinesterase
MLFGQSAGGFSVDNYAYAWAKEKDPIVNGIIAQSGSASANRGSNMVTSSNNTDAWAKQARTLNCPTEGTASLDCVRGKPWLDVLNAVRGGPTLSGGAMSPFSPTADEEVVFSNYAEQARKGQFIKVVCDYLCIRYCSAFTYD